MIKRISLLFCLCSVYFIGFAQEWEDSIQSAQLAFENKNYEQAGQIYHRLLEKGYKSSAFYYNVGLNYFHLDSLGKSILYLERALSSKPNNPQVLKTISDARSQMEDAVIPVEPFFLNEWLKSIASLCSPSMWGVLNLLFLGFICFGAYGIITGQQWLKEFPKTWSMVALSTVFLLTLLFGSARYQIFKTADQAIVMENDLELKVGPDELSTSDLTVFAGEKVFVLNAIGEWLHVELLNRDQGWLKKNSIEYLK